MRIATTGIVTSILVALIDSTIVRDADIPISSRVRVAVTIITVSRAAITGMDSWTRVTIPSSCSIDPGAITAVCGIDRTLSLIARAAFCVTRMLLTATIVAD